LPIFSWIKAKMKKPFDRKLVRFYLWVSLAYLVLCLVYDVHNKGMFFSVLVNNLWRLAYVLVLNFVFFELTVPFVMQRRKYIISNVFVGIGVFWLHLMLWSFGLYLWRFFGMGLGIYTSPVKLNSSAQGITSQMAYSTGSVFFFGIIRHLYNYTKLKHTAQQLRLEKQQAELNYLKSQTNPHFLFNTLNNIYSLARDKSDLAPESILRLSKILRYMLYETGGEYIAIEQELQIISDYIALEELRYDDSLRVNFNHDIEDMKQALPPLLLIPLVENAFKHGVSETRGQPFVDIHLSVKARQLVFIVKNSTDAFPEEKRVKENIGLSNLRRQLELLYTDFNLNAQQGESLFTATLKINLASHV
jgi:two-component system LytT family sensor kinase